jgi:hypothetical protein
MRLKPSCFFPTKIVSTVAAVAPLGRFQQFGGTTIASPFRTRASTDPPEPESSVTSHPLSVMEILGKFTM